MLAGAVSSLVALLPTSYFLLPTSYCLLPTAYCLLPTAYVLLPTSYALLPTSYRPEGLRIEEEEGNIVWARPRHL